MVMRRCNGCVDGYRPMNNMSLHIAPSRILRILSQTFTYVFSVPLFEEGFYDREGGVLVT
jgi:hypothetical protein